MRANIRTNSLRCGFIVAVAAAGCFHGESYAQAMTGKDEGTCCWATDPNQPGQDGLPARFSATVRDVKKSEERLILNTGNEDVRFRFDSSIGTREQRQLLDSVRPGDRLEGRRMNVEGTTRYHFDRGR